MDNSRLISKELVLSVNVVRIHLNLDKQLSTILPSWVEHEEKKVETQGSQGVPTHLPKTPTKPHVYVEHPFLEISSLFGHLFRTGFVVVRVFITTKHNGKMPRLSIIWVKSDDLRSDQRMLESSRYDKIRRLIGEYRWRVKVIRNDNNFVVDARNPTRSVGSSSTKSLRLNEAGRFVVKQGGLSRAS